MGQCSGMTPERCPSAPASYFGIRIAQDGGGPGPVELLFLAAGPLVITIAITRTRYLRARTPSKQTSRPL